MKLGFLLLAFGLAAFASAQEITNGLVTIRATKLHEGYSGFSVVGNGVKVLDIDLSSKDLIQAGTLTVRGDTLDFQGLTSKAGVSFLPTSHIWVTLTTQDPYPKVYFDLTLAGFDGKAWLSAAGQSPFHFLSLNMPEAEVWHQRGWLNATPLSDPFPLLQDKHAGTPEISGYTYNRRWSYTVPLGANPLPIIGLWAPKKGLYAGLEFETTRLHDNSERDIATGYYWGGPANGSKGKPAEQFVSLVYPYGGKGYQQLVLPKLGDHIASSGTLLWATDLTPAQDPNRLFYSYLWAKEQAHLPRVPAGVDLSWLPGGMQLKDFVATPGKDLISGTEPPFESKGTSVIYGWRWQYENPALVAFKNSDQESLKFLQDEATKILPFAKHFRVEGDDCVFWEKPLIGRWTDDWGGKGVTTLHNANGFFAGRLFLGLGLALNKPEYLTLADGVLNWAKHIVWTRNEFADVPSSPFAIGGTASASFCLEYYKSFANSSDPRRKALAQSALELAHSIVYRYMVMWPSDNNRDDNLDSAFLWEPNSGRDWTGAACANEVFWNLDTLAQTAVTTGDPVLMWALQGSLSRWSLLYQDKIRGSLAEYGPGDMAEGYGLYEGNIYGVGRRSAYGFAIPMDMIQPVGSSIVRVLAGEKSAMAFDRDGVHTGIRDYKVSPSGDFSFSLRGLRSNFDLSLTTPYADLSSKSIAIVRDGKTAPLTPGHGLILSPQAPWSVILQGLNGADQVVVGTPPEASSPSLPTLPPLTQGMQGVYVPPQDGPYRTLSLTYDARVSMNWNELDSWAALPRGPMWVDGVQFALPPNGGRSAVAKRVADLGAPKASSVALLYSQGTGPAPSVLWSDGTQTAVDPSGEVLAWRAWPPIYNQKLFAARVAVPAGKQLSGVDPGGRLLWGVSVAEGPLTATQSASFDATWLREAKSWQAEAAADATVAALGTEIAASEAAKRVAFFSGETSGQLGSVAGRSGFASVAQHLKPDDVIAESFTARVRPVLIDAASEDYPASVKESGDGARAIREYVKNGGVLILAASGPYPMYYATGKDGTKSDPLPPTFGVPLQIPFGSVPDDDLQVQLGSAALWALHLDSSVPMSFSFPTVDPRLRSIDTTKLPKDARYISLAKVVGKSGKNYGDAAGIVLLKGGGQVLYVWSGLLADDRVGLAFSEAVLRYALSPLDVKP